MANFTPTQGRYLSFIQSYIDRHGRPLAEAEIAVALCVSPPSVNQMMKMLEKKGLILRQPGQARAVKILIPQDEIPGWGNKRRRHANATAKPWAERQASNPPAEPQPANPPVNLWVLAVFLSDGPFGKKFSGKVIQRVIEIRGDQTLEDLHETIFNAYDRWDDHLYEFQFGKRPFDPAGPNIDYERAGATRLDDLRLKVHRAFGYWFDFGDNWYHQIQVERVEQAIPTVDYPRIIKRVGKSPPQYEEE